MLEALSAHVGTHNVGVVVTGDGVAAYEVVVLRMH
jgi:hypothetical protein